jgi:hypothetical protein
MAFDGSTHEVTLIGKVYRGYDISPIGSRFGLIWGFVDGWAGGAVFAWLYNLIAKPAVRTSPTAVESRHHAQMAH